MFGFIKEKLKKIYVQLSSKLSTIFASKEIDTETIKNLERILLEADTGVKITRELSKNLSDKMKRGEIKDGSELKEALEKKLLQILSKKEYQDNAGVILLVGVNGSGKTTTAGKLAQKLKNEGGKIVLVAADTFRAAAREQLEKIAERVEVDIVTGKENQDPASLVFSACEKYKAENYDTIIIDTAGRLQTKLNLMKELEKIGKIIKKHLPGKKMLTLITIDAMLGQNSFDQAKLFDASTKLDGIILTKLDGTGKGGIIFSITKEINVPVAYITFGENMDQIKKFDSKEYVSQLLNP